MNSELKEPEANQPEKRRVTKATIASDIEQAEKDIIAFQSHILKAQGIINYLSNLLKTADLPEA